MPHVNLLSNPPQSIAVQNIFCIGRNYAAHIAELGNKPADDPVVFLKPTSALNTTNTLRLPSHSSDVHYETELVLLMGRGGKNIPQADALQHIAGFGIGLDLTARDIQGKAKSAGLPWAVAKGFDDSATVSEFIPATSVGDWSQLTFRMALNGQTRQQGDVRQMLYSLPVIIAHLSQVFTLQAGDLVFTGTPEGVGALSAGDQIDVQLATLLSHTVWVK
ncbi:fumarylacetoacetate hydrolase family protein [Limnobacter humi]|uniref:Fumarylacetoacetate hydrolase family protein n=1 Tax=Limnobacter humi TaxID=1778671 RepID=A0ABT1WCN4_9BURK|nr:fumarylacetoacetate hydrolase family protein [Limnobacter humi]MCQ8895278.1 fumarylacetoacetate hydrolase family protein [Limnobacter humi]